VQSTALKTLSGYTLSDKLTSWRRTFQIRCRYTSVVFVPVDVRPLGLWKRMLSINATCRRSRIKTWLKSKLLTTPQALTRWKHHSPR